MKWRSTLIDITKYNSVIGNSNDIFREKKMNIISLCQQYISFDRLYIGYIIYYIHFHLERSIGL